MSEKKKQSEETVEGGSLSSMQESTTNARRIIRSVSPLGMRVLVKIRERDSITEGGLYLPENAKKNLSESLVAEVLEVASALDAMTDEETNVSGIPMGTTVLIPKDAGTCVPWDEALRIVDTKDVLALIEELSLT